MWCAGLLGGWGHGAGRRVRVLDGPAVLVRPRRSRCRECGRTHVLLPVWCLLRRAGAAAVIGAALVAAAAGAGFRVIARMLGRPPETVRGWLRRFASRAEAVRVFFTVLLARTSPDPCRLHQPLAALLRSRSSYAHLTVDISSASNSDSNPTPAC
jgi:hypothetical protein